MKGVQIDSPQKKIPSKSPALLGLTDQKAFLLLLTKAKDGVTIDLFYLVRGWETKELWKQIWKKVCKGKNGCEV